MSTTLRPAVQTAALAVPVSATHKRGTSMRNIVSNFAPVLGKTALVSTVSISRLVAMLDCEHGDGSKYVVVSKRMKQNGVNSNVTAVLDIPLRKLYLATNANGMTRYWQGLAAKYPQHVQYLKPSEVFTPSPEPERTPREFWYVRSQGADA